MYYIRMYVCLERVRLVYTTYYSGYINVAVHLCHMHMCVDFKVMHQLGFVKLTCTCMYRTKTMYVHISQSNHKHVGGWLYRACV